MLVTEQEAHSSQRHFDPGLISQQAEFVTNNNQWVRRWSRFSPAMYLSSSPI
jgi:hypothetical protein